MFIILTILALSKDLREKRFLESGTQLPWYFILLENIGDFVGEGMTLEIFQKIANGIHPNASLYFSQIIPQISNTSFQLIDLLYKNQNNGANGDQSSSKYEGSGIRYSQLLDENVNIIDILPESMKIMLENDDLFNQVSGIVTLLGSDLSTVLNLDYATIFNVYTYIMTNRKEKDGVKLGEIMKRLGLSTSWLPKMKQIVANFDSPVEIISLFNGLNCESEYKAFVQAATLFNIPTDYSQKFLSANNIFNLIGSAFNLVRAINENFVQTYLIKVIKPIISNYLIKIVDISSGPIKDRAESVINIINAIKSFGTSCPSTPQKQETNMKCVLFSTVQNMVCGLDEACKKGVWDYLVNKVKPFTADEVNFMKELKEFEIPETDISFYFGLMNILTSSSKSYLDIINGLLLKFGKVNFGPYKDADYREVANNITQLINFMSKIDGSSNIKVVFDYLNASQYWDYAKIFVNQINENTHLCNLIGDIQKCQGIGNMLKNFAGALISDHPFSSVMQSVLSTILGQDSQKINSILSMAQGFVIPPLSVINNNIDKFLTFGLISVKPALKVMQVNVPEDANFESFVVQTGTICEATLTMINKLLPSVFMKLPLMSDLYPQIAAKLGGLISVIKSNQKVRNIADSLYNGTGVVIDMLNNAVNIIAEDQSKNPKMIDVVKGLQPNTFLNVYQTAFNLNALFNEQNPKFGIRDIIDCIQYGDPKELQVLDDEAAGIALENIIPIKTVAANSQYLFYMLDSNDINVSTAAQFLGVPEKPLLGSLSSIAKSFKSAPSSVVKELATKVVDNENDLDNIFSQMASIGGTASIGQSSSLKGGDNSKSKNDEKKDEMPAGTLIGIVVACIVVIVVAILLGVYFSAAKKRNQISSANQNDSDSGKNEDSKENDDL